MVIVEHIRFVRVDWIDSARPSPAWEHVSDVDEPCEVRCTSVGWLVKENERALLLAPNIAHYMDTFQGCGFMTIPKKCVVSIGDLSLSPVKAIE